MKAQELSDDELAYCMQHMEMIEAFFKEVRARAMERLIRGRRIKGQKLVLGRRTRTWKDEDRTVTWCIREARLEDDEFRPRALLSVKGLEDVLKQRKRSKQLLSAMGRRLVKRNKPAIHIAPIADPRKPYKPGAEFIALEE